MIILTISDEQVQQVKNALEQEYFDEPVSVSEYAIMVWFQETLARLIGDPAFYADGPYGYNNTKCPSFELNAPVRDNNRENLPTSRLTKRMNGTAEAALVTQD